MACTKCTIRRMIGEMVANGAARPLPAYNRRTMIVLTYDGSEKKVPFDKIPGEYEIWKKQKR